MEANVSVNQINSDFKSILYTTMLLSLLCNPIFMEIRSIAICKHCLGHNVIIIIIVMEPKDVTQINDNFQVFFRPQ